VSKKSKDPRPVRERLVLTWYFDDGSVMSQPFREFGDLEKRNFEMEIESENPELRKKGIEHLANWSNTSGDQRAQHEYSTLTGKLGGSSPKRRLWAELLASELRKTLPSTEEEAWLQIPESTEPWEIEDVDFDYLIYRDGCDLIAIEEPSRLEKKLKKSTFFKNYYRKTKNKAK